MTPLEDHPNVKALADEGLSGEVNVTEELVRKKILFLLTIYPRLSPSMIQVGIGTSMPPALWRPILHQLIAEGLVKREQINRNTPLERYQTFTILSLAS